MERLALPRSSAARGFGLVALVPLGPLSRAALQDEDAEESAAGRALRAVRTAPTKGSSLAARRLRCVGAERRFPEPLSGSPQSWRLFSGLGRAGVRPGAGAAATASAPSRAAAAAAAPAACAPAPACRSLPGAAHSRAPPHPQSPPPLPPAHPARPPRARPTRAAAAAATLPALAARAARLRGPLSSPLPSRRRCRRRPRPRLPPPPSFPARVVANRRPPSCGGSRPDPRQPPAPTPPKHPVFAAARGGSPEGSLGCAEHRPGRWRSCGK